MKQIDCMEYHVNHMVTIYRQKSFLFCLFLFFNYDLWTQKYHCVQLTWALSLFGHSHWNFTCCCFFFVLLWQPPSDGMWVLLLKWNLFAVPFALQIPETNATKQNIEEILITFYRRWRLWWGECLSAAVYRQFKLFLLQFLKCGIGKNHTNQTHTTHLFFLKYRFNSHFFSH